MKKIILIIVLSLTVGVTLYSQDSLPILQPKSGVVRIAYINRSSIIAVIPQVETIEKLLSQLRKDYEAEFVKMTKEYESKVKSYLERNKQMSEPIKLARQTEITELEARMSMYKKRYQEEIAKQRTKLYAPINEYVEEAIRRVCEREQITILFDQGQPLYMSAQCVDLTSLVKVELGL
jgi:Skp family chaperone for outer membrane proteins